ncbi:YceI family protein [soil metagenome]
MNRPITLFSFILLGFIALSFSPINDQSLKIDTSYSKLIWTATKVAGSHTGGIQISNGTINFDGKAVKGGTLDIDMTSITCTDLTDPGYNSKLIGHLKSDDFFNVEKFKTSKFVIVSLKSLGGERFDITGNLTIKGITNSITFPATVKVTDNSIVTIGTAKIDRTKFDIKYHSGSFFENLGDKAIKDVFDLELNVIVPRR